MAQFSDDFIKSLVEAQDIVDVVERYLPLKKAGKDFTALCPFHSEKHPSFTVSRIKQFYHCFGCGAHGNIIDFIRTFTGASFVEVIQKLAQEQGKALPKEFNQDADEIAHVKQVSVALDKAQSQFLTNLSLNESATAYVQSRGISSDSVQRFGIGYATGFDFRHLKEAEIKLYIEAGLIGVTEYGRYERYTNRLTFPIISEHGRIIGFGGRVIQHNERQAKYINSPETALYEKGNELFALHVAKPNIRRTNQAVVVEGYIDVVMLHQHGENRSVAPLGTAITDRQLSKLFRLCDEVIICFDADKAGVAATERAARVALRTLRDGKVVKLLTLDSDHDPDSFVRAFGIESWNRYLQTKSIALSVYIVNHLFDKFIDTPEHRVSVIRQAKDILSEIKNAPIYSLALKGAIENRLGQSIENMPVKVERSPLSNQGRLQAGRLPFYQNFAMLCAIDVTLCEQVPDSAIDSLAASISAWFAIAPTDVEQRLRALAGMDRAEWTDIVAASVQQVSFRFLNLTNEMKAAEAEAVLKAVLRLSGLETRRKATINLFN